MKTVADLRDELVKLGLSQEEANEIKGKQNLVEKIQELSDSQETEDNLDSLLDEVEVEDEDNNITFDVPPTYASEDWDTYVMSQLQEDEIHDGRPTVVGLRRLAENLLGPIVDSGPTLVQSSLDSRDNGRAYCVYEVVISPWRRATADIDHGDDVRRFRGTADAYPGNIPNDSFSKFPTAMAEIRAEGRALKRALQIKTVVSEEVADASLPDLSALGEWNGNDNINEAQIKFIKTKCKQLKIDVDKFINSGENDYDKIEDIKKHTAAQMIQRLNQYQNSSKVEIPKEVKLEG